MRRVININQSFDHFEPAVTAEMLKKAGFDGADFGLFQLNDPNNQWFAEDWYIKAEELKKTFVEAGLPIVQSHSPFYFPLFDDPMVYIENIRPAIIRSLEVAAALGAECCVVHPVHCITYWPNSEILFQANMAYYRSLIPVCKDLGIRIAVENMFHRDSSRGNRIIHSACSRVEEFCRYIDTLDSEYIVACLDIGHTVLPSENTSVPDFIRTLGHDRLKTLHIHDNNFLDDQHLIPFAGKIDWYPIAEALGQIDYTGDFVYESLLDGAVHKLSPEAYPIVLRYMAGIAGHLIEHIDKNRPSVI